MKTWETLLFVLVTFFVSASENEADKKLNTAANAPYLSSFEKEIIFEINLFRSNPKQYATSYIAPLARHYQKKVLHYPNDKSIRTKEGIRALNECVRVLKKENPLPLLYPDVLLSRAAKDHQIDQARTGKTGHIGSDRSNVKQRIERYGEWQVKIAENIAYGDFSARQYIIFLLIDDAVKDRGHRKNMLTGEFNRIGVSCGSHPLYTKMCVMDFAGGIKDK